MSQLISAPDGFKQQEDYQTQLHLHKLVGLDQIKDSLSNLIHPRAFKHFAHGQTGQMDLRLCQVAKRLMLQHLEVQME
jgi:hypothetical protein